MNDLEDNQPQTPDMNSHGLKKKRVCKACDSCRIKKTKCNGMKPCMRCISNNKICTYTERRRSKDKSYPAGYVELLETRLDILTRSLKKLFEMSEAGENLSSLRSDSTGELSINRLISRLVDKENLFKNQPVEWEHGTDLAANFENDEEYVKSASAEFADHSRHVISASNENRVQKKGRGRRRGSKNRRSLTSLSKKIPPSIDSELSSNSSRASSLKSPIEVKSEVNGIDKLGFNIDLGPFQSGSELATAAMNRDDGNFQMSEIDSDEDYYLSPSFSPCPDLKYQFPSFDTASEISTKNNSISSLNSVRNMSVSSPLGNSNFDDLSTYKIQTHHNGPSSLSNEVVNSPTDISMAPQSSIVVPKTTEDINQAAKLRQIEADRFALSKINENDFTGFGNIIEPSHITNNGHLDDVLMSNIPITYSGLDLA